MRKEAYVKRFVGGFAIAAAEELRTKVQGRFV
jgi:hypothetical protein